jgi:hypothetical protein
MLWKSSAEAGAAANVKKIKVMTVVMNVLQTIKVEAVRLNGKGK